MCRKCVNVKYIGEVKLKERNSAFKYGLYDNSTINVTYFDIDQELDRIYKSEYKKISVEMFCINELESVFKQIGLLYKDKTFGMYEWFIGDDNFKGVSLDSKLFNLVGEKIVLSITVHE